MNSAFEVVTTFHKEGYEKYGKRMIETFDEMYDKNIKLVVYYEGMDEPELKSPRIEYRSYEETCGKKQAAFEAIAKPHEARVMDTLEPSVKFKFAASRFAHKYYALAHANELCEKRYLVLCDADVVACDNIDDTWLSKFVQEGKYWSRVGRGSRYPECGFMIWDRASESHTPYWEAMQTLYDEGKLFELEEWHDSYVWWTAEKQLNLENLDIGGGFKGHAFVKGPLGEKLDHLKGDRKDEGFSKERQAWADKAKATKHAVVMTLPAEKFDVYGYCMRGFIENWPKEVQGYAIVEKPELLPTDLVIPDNLTVLNFDEVCGERIKAFEERNKDKGIFDLGTTGNIAVQAAKFARKAIAQLYVLENIDADVIWYTDADLYTHKPVSMEVLESLTSTEAYMGFTPRWWNKKTSIQESFMTKTLGSKGFTETGLMFWKPKHEQHKAWVELYGSMYDEDKIFEQDAWHDCVAFDYATISLYMQQKIQIVDLGYGQRSSHPLVSGPLGRYFDHMKGRRKFVGHSQERVRMHGQ